MSARVLLLACLVSGTASAQAISEQTFAYPPLATAKDFEGKVGRAQLPQGWPEVDDNVRASEVRFDRGAMTRWHRHEGSQYLVGTEGNGFIESYDGSGQRQRAQIAGGGKVHVPARTCHRHGSDGSTPTFSHVYVTVGATYWDDCAREFDTAD